MITLVMQFVFSNNGLPLQEIVNGRIKEKTVFFIIKHTNTTDHIECVETYLICTVHFYVTGNVNSTVLLYCVYGVHRDVFIKCRKMPHV